MDGKYMSSTKNVVWIIPGFAASMEDDSCIPTTLELLKYIETNKDIKVSVIALQYPFTSEKYQLFGTDIYPVNGQNKWYNKLSVWKKAMRILKNLDNQHRIAVVHSFWLGETALIAQAFSKDKKIRHICTLMGQDVLTDNRHLRNKYLDKITFVALSQFQAAYFEKNAKRKVDAVIPFGLPKTELSGLEKKYDIIGVGSLIPVKNYRMWIEIIESVKASYPNLKAILVGHGEELEELKALSQRKNLVSTIQFFGQQKRTEVLKLIEQSRIFLHTSKHEGQGYVFMEAMSKKIPILSTPVGYAIEDAKIWKGTDIQAFSEVIIHILRKLDSNINYKVPDIKETFEKYWEYYTE